MSLPDRWLQFCFRFWNPISSLPVDDLYRDVLSDSVLNNVSLTRGFQESICDIGLAYHSACSNHTYRASMKKASQHNCGTGSRTVWRHRWAWTLAPAAPRARPAVRTGAGSGAQTASKSIACVLVFSVMTPHLRGHASFYAFGWDVIFHRQSPDAALEFHDPSDHSTTPCHMSLRACCWPRGSRHGAALD